VANKKSLRALAGIQLDSKVMWTIDVMNSKVELEKVIAHRENIHITSVDAVMQCGLIKWCRYLRLNLE